MIKCGVIGHPVSHSKSPLIHNHWMAQYNVTGDYRAIDIAPDDLHRDVQQLIDNGYAGFNVTVPHKVAIMALCHDLDDTARAIGAVNTVVLKDGKLFGKNTDAFGFIENIKTSQPGMTFGKPAIVLGAGGAARAVVYALLKEGVPHITLINRSIDNAQALAAMEPTRIDVAEWNNRDDLGGCGLLINTTSLGMKGQAALDIDLSNLPPDAVVNDIVYAPLMTDLLQAASKRGNPTVTGIGMLLHQARPAFQAWTDIMPDVDDTLTQKVLA